MSRYHLSIRDRLQIALWYIVSFVVVFFIIETIIMMYNENEFYKEDAYLIIIASDLINAFVSGFLTLTLIPLTYNHKENGIVDDSNVKFDYLGFVFRTMAIYSVINLLLASCSGIMLSPYLLPNSKSEILSYFIYGLKECYRGGALFTFVTVIYSLNNINNLNFKR